MIFASKTLKSSHLFILHLLISNSILMKAQYSPLITAAKEEALPLTQRFSALGALPCHFLSEPSQLAPKNLTLHHS